MSNLIFTNKTASYGTLSGLPLVDVSTTCPSINPSYYQAALGTLSPVVVAGQFMIVKVTVQNAVGAAVRTLRITKADGVTVLIQFAPANQPAVPSESTTIYSARVIIGNPADWINCKMQVSAGAAGDVVTIKAGSLVFAFAESCNITDETLVKRNIGSIHFMSMQPTQEAIYGRIGSPSAVQFLTVPVNGLVSGFVWNTNSGNTLYSWDGKTIGIGA